MRKHCFVFALIVLAVAGAAQAGRSVSLYGTWVGTPIIPGLLHGPGVFYSPITLVAGPVWVRVESTGPTTASHDAADATSTCTTRYRFNSVLSTDGWRLYVQEGQPKVTGSGAATGGPPSTGICGSTPLPSARDAVRLRPAGTKLRAEWGTVNPAAKVVDPTLFDHHYNDAAKRGYLHRK
jgi:hypothetical protein